MSTTQNKDAWNLEEIEFKREIPEEKRHRAGWMINTIKFMRIRGWLSTKWASKSSGILESKMDTPKPLEGSKLSELNIADGLKDGSFDLTQKGIHLNADDFNTLLAQPDTICVDMRNHYESEVGHFKGALTPDVDTFRESLPLIEQELAHHKEDKKLLMY